MRKLIAIPVALLAIALLLTGVGCSAISGTEDESPTLIQTEMAEADNDNGAVFSLSKSQLISNLNSAIEITGSNIAKVESLDEWNHSATADSDADASTTEESFTFYTNNLGTSTDAPSFDALAFKGSSKIGQVRVSWTSDQVDEDPDTFKEYSLIGIMAALGFNQSSAEALYDNALDEIYRNGNAVSLTYTCYGNFRCYLMISGDYEMIVIEPYSDAVRTAQEELGVFGFEDMDSEITDPYTISGVASRSNSGSSSASSQSSDNGSASSSDSSQSGASDASEGAKSNSDSGQSDSSSKLNGDSKTFDDSL